jgi:hypothetical protein
MELSEHPPYLPRDGAWLQRQIVDAVINSPVYNKTVLMISWDGQFFKHMMVLANLMQRLVVLEIMLSHIIPRPVQQESGWMIRMEILVVFIPVLVSP